MSETDVRLPQHGRDQRIVGPDPIPPGRWVYVGDYPGDPDTTADSTPFENGVTNTGGGLQRLRFRRTNENELYVEGEVDVPDGSSFPLVVTTLTNPLYIPQEAGLVVAASGETGAVVWKLDTNGELSILGFVGGPGSDTSAVHYGVNETGVWISNTVTGTDPITGGSYAFTLPVAGEFYVLDHLGNIRLGVGDLGDLVAVTAADGTQSFAVRGDDALDRLVVQPTIGTTVTLDTGEQITVKDSGGNLMLRMTEGSPNLHIKTGGTVIADL